MKYRTKREEVVNSLTHLVPGIFSFIALLAIVFIGKVSYIPFYAFSSLTFLSSFLYHRENDDLERKARLRQIDIGSIYWTVFGSTQIFMPAELAVGACITAAALSWPAFRLGANGILSDASLIMFSVVSLSVAVIHSPSQAFMLVLGAAVYLFGTYFYFVDNRPWFHTIWHLFVVAGWTIHLIQHVKDI